MKIIKDIKKIRVHKYLRIPAGIFFIILGIIGGLLPFIQGWIFMLLGLTILFGEDFTNLLENMIKKFRNRFKKKSH